MISKTEFVRGLDCERRLWLDRFRPDLEPSLGLAALERIETGKALGSLARKRYPDGMLVRSPYGDHDAAAEMTLNLIEAGETCLFEATFIAGEHLVRVDVLSKGTNGGWILDEVKSSSVKEPDKIDEDKVFDLAFQAFTLKEAGLKIEAARLVLVDTTYIWDGGPFDPQAMLGIVDLTAKCEELRPLIVERSRLLANALKESTEPEVETNTHCKKCDYFAHCYVSRSKHDVIHFPYIRPELVRKLRALGFD